MLQIVRYFLLFTSLSLLNVAYADNALSLVDVTGKGKVFAQPDQASLSLHFTDTNFKLDLARQSVDERVSSLLSILDEFTLDKSSLDTSQVSIQPRYDYRPNNQRDFVGYHVTRRISFKLTALAELDALVKALSGVEVSGLDSIRFVHSAPEKLQEQALEKAIQHSKELANKIAKSYGKEIASVHRVNYQSHSQQPAPRMMAMAEMASDSRGSNYQQKDLAFEAQVHASFLLK